MNTAEFYHAFAAALAQTPQVRVCLDRHDMIRLWIPGGPEKDDVLHDHCPITFVAHTRDPKGHYHAFTFVTAARALDFPPQQATRIMNAADDFPGRAASARQKLLAIIAPYLTK